MADSARARIVWRIGLVLLGGFLVSFCIGFLIRNPGFFDSVTEQIHQMVTGQVAGVDLNFKQPGDYLRLLNLDPKIVPGNKRPLAIVLHDAYHDLASGDSGEQDAIDNFNRSIESLLGSSRDGNAFATVKSSGQAVKEACQKRVKFYHDLEGSLAEKLHTVGLSTDLATKVSAAFGQQMGVQGLLQQTEESEKTCDAKLAIVDALEKDKSEAQRGPSGEIIFSSSELLKQFRTLFPDVPAAGRLVAPALSPGEYGQRCHAVAVLPTKDLPKSGDPALETLCDTRIFQSVLSGKPTPQKLNDIVPIGKGLEELSQAYARSAGTQNEFFQVERFGMVCLLDYDRAGRQFIASLPKNQIPPGATEMLTKNREILTGQFKQIASNLSSPEADTQYSLVARRRMAFLMQETFGQAKEFLDPSIAKMLSEAQQKDPDPMVQKALEAALKE
jgi:hypothetical protein